MKYNTLLFDADETLLDFPRAESEGFKKALSSFGVTPTPQMEKDYVKINLAQWKLFEKGLTTKEKLIIDRYQILIDKYSLNLDPAEVNKTYIAALSEGHFLIEGAYELCEKLSKDFNLYLITNGVSTTQERRMRESGLRPFFIDTFVSEDVGYPKPHIEYFNFVKEKINGFNGVNTLIIGDSLTSDIQGGINSGIDTCWFNPNKQKNTLNIKPTYEVESYEELINLLYNK